MTVYSKSYVDIQEIDGNEPENKTIILPLVVESHWNRDNLVVLKIDIRNMNSLTVSANDLRTAIDNATNTARHMR